MITIRCLQNGPPIEDRFFLEHIYFILQENTVIVVDEDSQKQTLEADISVLEYFCKVKELLDRYQRCFTFLPHRYLMAILHWTAEGVSFPQLPELQEEVSEEAYFRRVADWVREPEKILSFALLLQAYDKRSRTPGTDVASLFPCEQADDPAEYEMLRQIRLQCCRDRQTYLDRSSRYQSLCLRNDGLAVCLRPEELTERAICLRELCLLHRAKGKSRKVFAEYADLLDQLSRKADMDLVLKQGLSYSCTEDPKDSEYEWRLRLLLAEEDESSLLETERFYLRHPEVSLEYRLCASFFLKLAEHYHQRGKPRKAKHYLRTVICQEDWFGREELPLGIPFSADEVVCASFRYAMILQEEGRPSAGRQFRMTKELIEYVLANEPFTMLTKEDLEKAESACNTTELGQIIV